jgi:hypothetical protein
MPPLLGSPLEVDDLVSSQLTHRVAGPECRVLKSHLAAPIVVTDPYNSISRPT